MVPGAQVYIKSIFFLKVAKYEKKVNAGKFGKGKCIFIYTASQHTWQNDALCLPVSGYDIISEAI